MRTYLAAIFIFAALSLQQVYAYSPYGDRTTLSAQGTELTSASTDYGFTGRRFDAETGMWYFRARYFDSEMGRFVSRDPLGYVDGYSLYTGYFAQILGLDPLGMEIATHTLRDDLAMRKRKDAIVKNLINSYDLHQRKALQKIIDNVQKGLYDKDCAKKVIKSYNQGLKESKSLLKSTLKDMKSNSFIMRDDKGKIIKKDELNKNKSIEWRQYQVKQFKERSKLAIDFSKSSLDDYFTAISTQIELDCKAKKDESDECIKDNGEVDVDKLF
jgi:RHS repeat-associated protein